MPPMSSTGDLTPREKGLRLLESAFAEVFGQPPTPEGRADLRRAVDIAMEKLQKDGWHRG